MNKSKNARKFTLRIIAAYVLMTNVSVMAGVVAYKVKKGETLSEILYNHGLRPLYGKNGFVKITSDLNIKKNINKNGNFVRSGVIINLPENKLSMAEVAPTSTENQEKIDAPILSDFTPKAQRESREPSDEYPMSRFTYSPHIGFLRIDSNNNVKFGGSDVTALSKIGLSASLNWQVLYDDLYSFYGYGTVDYFSFHDDSVYVLNKTNITRMHFGLGAGYALSPVTKINAELSMKQVTFLDVTSATTVNIESINVPELKIGIDKVIFTKKKLSGLIEAHATVLMPSKSGSYESDLGLGAGAGLEVIHGNKALSLKYDYRSMKLGDIENKESTIMLGFNFFGDFFL